MAERILVTGYTGRLGGMVATHLARAQNRTPRVLVRAAHLEHDAWTPPSDVEVAVGDYESPEALDAALDGIEAVFLVSPVHPEMRSRELMLAARAAAQACPPKIVKISGLGTALDSFVDSGRWHAEIEQGMLDLGLESTFLRPLFFMQNLGFQAKSIREEGKLSSGIGDAAIGMVDARDIAEVAAALLASDEPFTGTGTPVTGPACLTYDEVAALASNAFDRPVRYVRQSLEEVHAALTRSGQPDWHIAILEQFTRAFIQGWGDVVSDVVEQTLGRAPRTLAAYLNELAAGGGVTGTDPFPN